MTWEMIVLPGFSRNLNRVYQGRIQHFELRVGGAKSVTRGLGVAYSPQRVPGEGTRGAKPPGSYSAYGVLWGCVMLCGCVMLQ